MTSCGNKADGSVDRRMWTKSIPMSQFDQVYYASKDEARIIQNRRVKFLLKTNSRIILLENDPNEGIDAKNFKSIVTNLQAKDLNAVVYPVEPKVKTARVARNKNEVSIHGFDTYRKVQEDLDVSVNTQKYLYVPMKGNSWTKFDKNTLLSLNNFLEESGYKVCGISEKSIKVIQKDKNFQSLEGFLKDYVPTVQQLKAVKSFGALNRDIMGGLVYVEGVKDSFLKKAIAEYASFTKQDKYPPDILKDVIMKTKEYFAFSELDSKLKEELQKYPLLKAVGAWTIQKYAEDFKIYINAKSKEL